MYKPSQNENDAKQANLSSSDSKKSHIKSANTKAYKAPTKEECKKGPEFLK